MFGQTSVNNGHHARSSGFRDIVGDCVELGGLQLQLLSVDGKQASQRAVKGAVFCGAAFLFGLTTLLTATLGGGWLIHEWSGLSVGVSFLIMAGCMLVLTVCMAIVGGMLFKRAADSMQETASELQANVKWIKEVLFDPESSRNQMRAPMAGEDRFGESSVRP